MMETNMKNIFIEGIQGSGKSTLTTKLSKKLSDYSVYTEGDISPVELAWCSYMTEQEFNSILKKYSEYKEEILKNTKKEGNRYITAYTRILTDTREFYQDMESFEIYNARIDYDTFKSIILDRYTKLNSFGNIFECSFFQNSIEDMMLFYQMEDDAIIDFYSEAYNRLKDKNFKLLYIDSDNIRENIVQIKKDRVDINGNEMWFPLMMNYLKESPYGKVHNYKNMDDMINHFERRRQIEKRIINEVIKEDCIVLQSKQYDIETLSI